MSALRDLSGIETLLHAYRDFSECVVRSVEWRDYGTTLAVTIDYIWNPDGSIRGAYDRRRLVDLQFRLVQELRIRNALRAPMLENPAAINWGLNEVALVRVSHDQESEAYRSGKHVFHHAVFWREGGPWIDIIFAELESDERFGPPLGDDD